MSGNLSTMQVRPPLVEPIATILGALTVLPARSVR